LTLLLDFNRYHVCTSISQWYHEKHHFRSLWTSHINVMVYYHGHIQV